MSDSQNPHALPKPSRRRRQVSARRRAAEPRQTEDEGLDLTSQLITLNLSPSMPSTTRLLVCSVGNPGPSYLNTLHSAGHTVLRALQPLLSSNTPFKKSPAHGGGLLSTGPLITLYQSPSFMNVSGPAIWHAWRTFVDRNHGLDSKIVILHDELESPLGTVKSRAYTASARGHNGLKSIKAHLPGRVQYTQLGIGIGRPTSKDPDVVAGYVLKKMSGPELAKIEGCAAEVERELRRITGDDKADWV